jgi:hypothetical protein
LVIKGAFASHTCLQNEVKKELTVSGKIVLMCRIVWHGRCDGADAEFLSFMVHLGTGLSIDEMG